MAKAEWDKPPCEVVETDMAIVGGGICGILAAKMCGDRRWPYVVVERNEELGGVWGTLANKHSYLQARLGGAAGRLEGSARCCGGGAACDHWPAAAAAAATSLLPPPAGPLAALPLCSLQCYEPNYRWDDSYRINQDELTKGSAVAVKQVRSGGGGPRCWRGGRAGMPCCRRLLRTATPARPGVQQASGGLAITPLPRTAPPPPHAPSPPPRCQLNPMPWLPRAAPRRCCNATHTTTRWIASRGSARRC